MTDAGFEVLDWGWEKTVLWIDSERIEECMSYYRQNEIDGVILSSFRGYRLKHIEFLRDHPYVKGASFLDAEDIDISALEALEGLEFLSIEDNRQPLDLGAFPKLQGAWMDWHPKLVIPSGCDELRCLSLHHYKPKSKDLTELSELPRLEDLSIIQAPLTNIDGVAGYRTLKRLELSYLPKLGRIEAIVGLRDAQLVELECKNCKTITDHHVVAGLPSLKILRFNSCGTIPDLKFLRGMQTLEKLAFVNTNVVDGDLTPILELERLTAAGFTNKRHFTHKCEEIKKTLEYRHPDARYF